MTIVTGHVGGAPVEELLLPFLAAGGTALAAAARLSFHRLTGRRTRRTPR